MKRTSFTVVCILALIFIAPSSFAQMGGGMMGEQKGMVKGQMMSKDMMHDMSEMMKQMNGMMQKLSHPMEHMTITEHSQMQRMGQIMRNMASEMNEMATHMEKGSVDRPTVKKIQERMKAINQEIDALQKK
ncbi:MAG: DUF4175 domain-containing protein [Nitrospirota bacterium]|nr:DUF4175 domain-containing protein [Nitrospirota bacterium]